MAFDDLTTLEDVRSWLTAAANVTPPPDSDNDMLERLIEAGSDFIKQWVGRPLIRQNYLETRDGIGTPLGKIETRYQLAVYPIVSVNSVKVLGRDIPPIPSGTVGVSAGYLFSPTQVIIRGYHVPRLAQCVEVEYTAGYSEPPAAIAQACIEFVGFKYRERQHIGISMQTIQAAQTQYHWGLFKRTDIGSDIEATLMQYKAVAPVGMTQVRVV